jgi:hypothetical protein
LVSIHEKFREIKKPVGPGDWIALARPRLRKQKQNKTK